MEDGYNECTVCCGNDAGTTIRGEGTTGINGADIDGCSCNGIDIPTDPKGAGGIFSRGRGGTGVDAMPRGCIPAGITGRGGMGVEAMPANPPCGCGGN